MHFKARIIMEKLSVGSQINNFLMLLWHQCFFIGWIVVVYGGSIAKSTWKEFEYVENHFFKKFLQVKKQMPSTSDFLRHIDVFF